MRQTSARHAFTREFYRKNRWNFGLTLLGMTIGTALEMLIAYVMQQLMDIPAGQANYTFTQIIYFGVFLLLGMAANEMMLRKVRNAYVKRAMCQYRRHAFSCITQKSIHSFSSESTSRYLSALTNDATTVETNYVDATCRIIYNMLYFCAAVAMMFFFSWHMTLVVMALILLPLVLSMLMGRKLTVLEQGVSRQNEGFISMVKDMLSGFSVIKSFKAEKEVRGVFDAQNDKLEGVKCDRRRAENLVGIISGVSAALSQFGIFFYGTYLAMNGEITVGVVLAFVQLMNYVLSPLRTLPTLVSNRKAAAGLIEKLAAAVGENAQHAGTLRPESVGEGICCRDVAFAYDAESGDVLKGVATRFEAGKSYAIVGASGCGKSTLLSLLLGAHSDYRGSITLGGAEIRDIDPDRLYDIVSIIQQNVFIFDDTIAQNVAMFKDFPKQQMESALERAGLKTLLDERGADFPCGENGAALSGGERQRISIARCLLRNTPVLLMDEATAALDNATVVAVTDAILSINGLTRIIVTHKIDEALMRRFDRIVALSGGRVAEEGDYDELMEKKGYFYSLVQVAQ